jgi:hypothetical protein
MSTFPKDDAGHAIYTGRIDWDHIQTVSYDGSTATSAALPAGCTLVIVWSSTDTCFKLAASPTAAVDNTSVPLTGKTYLYLPVGLAGAGSKLDATDKIAFIKQSTAGTAWVLPCL